MADGSGNALVSKTGTPLSTDRGLLIRLIGQSGQLIGTVALSSGSTVTANQGTSAASPGWMVHGSDLLNGSVPSTGMTILALNDVSTVLDTLHLDGSGNVKIANQNLLSASDNPDVTVNQSRNLKVQLVDPYTGTPVRIDSNGNLLSAQGTVPNLLSATEPNLIPNSPQYAPLNPAKPPSNNNPLIGYAKYRQFT
jgi:hypothetical protein